MSGTAAATSAGAADRKLRLIGRSRPRLERGLLFFVSRLS
jgi:hypothetical protein